MNIETHLKTLSEDIGARPVGSRANRAAEDYIARILEQAGLVVERQTFPCFDWQPGKTELCLDGNSLPVRTNPYTLPCDVRGQMLLVATLAELEKAKLENKIVVMHSELAREPLFPKNFKFVTIEEQQRIISLLECGKPAALIAVAASDGEPAPLFEDGDFEIPSVTVNSIVGSLLLRRSAAAVSLQIEASRTVASGSNVIARTGTGTGKKIVICAHLDTKRGTPGALDNAAGVAALLASAQKLARMEFPFALEWVAFNGEDYYSTPGQLLYLEKGASDLENIVLVINMDGIGWKQSPNSIAFFNYPEALANSVMALAPNHVRIEPWYQGDHAMFAMQGVPAIAFSSVGVETLVDSVIHTAEDTLAIVDAKQVAQVVDVIVEILLSRAASNQSAKTASVDAGMQL